MTRFCLLLLGSFLFRHSEGSCASFRSFDASLRRSCTDVRLYETARISHGSFMQSTLGFGVILF